MTVQRVCILGASLQTGNMGVSALAASLVKLIKETVPHAEISFFLGARTEQSQIMLLSSQEVKIKVINYRLSPKANIGEHLLWLFLMAVLFKIIPFNSWKDYILRKNRRLVSIQQADIIGNISGGDSFSDIYGLGRFLSDILSSLIVILMGKKLYLLPQTYGPYHSRLSKYLARVIMEKSDIILARDSDSLAIARRILVGKADSKLTLMCPDVAFALEAATPCTESIYPPLNCDGHRDLIGLNVNGLLYNGGYSRDNMFNLAFDYKQFVHELAKRLMEDTEGDLLLIPHTYGPPGGVQSDPLACKEVFQSLAKYADRVHLLQGEHDQHALKGIIGLSTFFIGSRMHSCIAALSQAIPTIAVAYSKKFKGVFDYAGMGHMVVDARVEDMDSAIRKIVSSYKHSEIDRSDLQIKIDGMKNDLRATFEKILAQETATGVVVQGNRTQSKR